MMWHLATVSFPTLLSVVWSFIFIRSFPDLLMTPVIKELPRHTGQPPDTFVSVIIAARDEETAIVGTLESLVCQTVQNLELIVVDDRSTDATPEIIERYAKQYNLIKAKHITSLPSGWIGKNHALWCGAEVASGEWLLFLDADVRLSSDAIARALSYVQEAGIQHVTVAPTLRTRGFFVRLLTMMFAFNLIAFTRPQSARHSSSTAYTGIGAFNLVRRDAYIAIGTHRAFRLRPDDDIYLGKCLKRARYKQHFAVARNFAQLEWYPNLGGMMRGLEKSPLPAFRYIAWAVPPCMLAMLCLYWGPYLGIAFASGSARFLYLYNIMLVWLLSIPIANALHLPKHQVWLLPLGAGLYCLTFLRSAWLATIRGGLVWRDTFYSLRELRRGL